MATITAVQTRARPAPEAKAAPRFTVRQAVYSILVVVFLVAVAFGRLYLAAMATDAVYSINRMERQQKLLLAEVDDLRAQIAGLSSPTRIEGEAARLGLKPIAGAEYISSGSTR